MLDVKFIRSNLELVRESLRKRGSPAGLEDFQELDRQRRTMLSRAEELKYLRNQVSEKIAEIKQQGGDASEHIAEMKKASQAIKEMDSRTKEIEAELKNLVLHLPNIPHASVPEGKNAADNEVVRSWGSPPHFTFELLPHWDIAAGLDIIDFERGARVSGARFVFYKGLGARLERALINFMLDLHSSRHGYQEIFPPFLVRDHSMVGTGQLPKFKEDMFKVEGQELYLIPTAEVPVTNFHREEILKEEDLPRYYTAYSGCFRAEAGAHGRDTRGLIRQHQFNKVELVKFTTPETSYAELEKLTADAEKVLQLLKLPYRVVNLSTGDLGFAAAKTYDLEVWLPSYGEYKEISSCSNFEDFQARRAHIRYRSSQTGRAAFVHTLNGSGVAVGRTVAAILENNQRPDRSVLVPEILCPYLGGVDVLR